MTDRPGEGYVFRYSQALKRLLSAKSGEPLHELAPELVAAIILELDRAEYHALLNQVDWSTGFVSVAASVSHVGQVEIFNPSGSGLLVVLTYAKINNAGGGTYVLAIDGAAGATPAQNVPLDTRVKSVASQNRILNTATGVSGVEVDRLVVPANTDAEFSLLKRNSVILTPSHRVAIMSATQNQLLAVEMAGYERPLEVEENVNL